MNIVAIVQARLGSTRLPGKVLKRIKEDKIVLDYVFERIRKSKKIDEIVLATTTNNNDEKLVLYAKKNRLKFFRGSEEDVLSRYYLAAKEFNADIIVRITSDCPLIDPEIIDKMIDMHINSDSDYTSNTINRTYPRGLDVEIFNFDALEISYKNAHETYQREHVTPYISQNKNMFNLQNYDAKGKIKRPDIRITVDTKEDLELIRRIALNFENLDFTSDDIIDFLDQNPELLKINENIKQKKLGE